MPLGTAGPDAAMQRAIALERTMARIRWGAVVFGFVHVLTYYRPYPPGMFSIAFAVAVGLATAALAIHVAVRRVRTAAGIRRLSLAALAADVAVCLGFVFVYTFDVETAVFALVYILPLEGALRYQLRGALATMGAAGVVYAAREAFGTAVYGHPFLPVSISFRMGIGFIIAAVAGATARGLVRERNQLGAALERLARHTEESDSLLDAISDAGLGFVLVRGARLIAVNDAFCSMTAYGREELLALDSIDRITEPAELDLVREQLRNPSDEPRRYDLSLRRKDGRSVDVEVAVKTLRDGEDSPVIAVLRDVTERKRLDEMKDAFLTAVSHELRTPLTAILGFAFTLGREGLTLSPEQSRDLTGRIVSRARKLDRLLQDLLDVDRLVHGAIEPHRRPTDLASLVHRVVADSDIPASRKVRIEATPVVASVDSGKVERIVENLIANAVKYTPSGCTVWVKVRPVADGVLLLVEDDGPGIPEDLRELVFEPFRRGQAEVGHSPGVGVGLTLVARFARLHGGRAWVEQREGGGASFRTFLPDASRRAHRRWQRPRFGGPARQTPTADRTRRRAT